MLPSVSQDEKSAVLFKELRRELDRLLQLDLKRSMMI